jgi:hypothetical protein
VPESSGPAWLYRPALQACAKKALAKGLEARDYCQLKRDIVHDMDMRP